MALQKSCPTLFTTMVSKMPFITTAFHFSLKPQNKAKTIPTNPNQKQTKQQPQKNKSTSEFKRDNNPKQTNPHLSSNFISALDLFLCCFLGGFCCCFFFLILPDNGKISKLRTGDFPPPHFKLCCVAWTVRHLPI